jgi:GTPase
MMVLRRQLAALARRRETTRRRRARNRVPAVAITGYTNAGKSCPLNRRIVRSIPIVPSQHLSCPRS